MKWIPVSERLPEEDTHVQAYSDGKYHRVYIGEAVLLDSEWLVFNPNKETFMVTHWKPLPEPPEG